MPERGIEECRAHAHNAVPLTENADARSAATPCRPSRRSARPWRSPPRPADRRGPGRRAAHRPTGADVSAGPPAPSRRADVHGSVTHAIPSSAPFAPAPSSSRTTARPSAAPRPHPPVRPRPAAPHTVVPAPAVAGPGLGPGQPRRPAPPGDRVPERGAARGRLVRRPQPGGIAGQVRAVTRGAAVAGRTPPQDFSGPSVPWGPVASSSYAEVPESSSGSCVLR